MALLLCFLCPYAAYATENCCKSLLSVISIPIRRDAWDLGAVPCLFMKRVFDTLDTWYPLFQIPPFHQVVSSSSSSSSSNYLSGLNITQWQQFGTSVPSKPQRNLLFHGKVLHSFKASRGEKKIPQFRVCKKRTLPARWVPTSYKEGYDPYKWPYNWSNIPAYKGL